MALTRKMLKAMGIEDEKIEQIIEAHAETVDALKEAGERYKADAEKLPELQKQLDAANKIIEDGKKENWKQKYDNLVAEVQSKETRAAKEAAYRSLLAEIGIPEKRLNTVIKATNLDALDFADGKFAKPDEIKKTAAAEWADFIETSGTIAPPPATPPAGQTPDTSKMTDAEYFAYQRSLATQK